MLATAQSNQFLEQKEATLESNRSGTKADSLSKNRLINEHLTTSLTAMQVVATSDDFRSTLLEAADIMTLALRAGGKLMFCGNGGSAADAQHIAGEFVSRLNFDRSPLAALALTVDTSVLTAIGNDYGYDKVFERQVLALGRPGDVLVAISTSGSSPNVIRAVEAAASLGMRTIGFGGNRKADLHRLCEITVDAPSPSTPIIQQVHIMAAHIVCGLVEEAMFGRPA